MARRIPKTISLITTDGNDVTTRASSIEALAWVPKTIEAEIEQVRGEYLKVTSTRTLGQATVTTTNGEVHGVAMDLPTYNALVADWALSAPGRTTSLRFAIRANARAGRLTGAETWPRNKP